MNHFLDFGKAIGLLILIVATIYASWLIAIMLVITIILLIFYYVFKEIRKFKNKYRGGH